VCGLLMSPMSRTAVVLGALAAKKGEASAPAEPAAPAEEAVAA
jgi:large subunit ribosomal protein L10